jgi:hypothetical protein
MDSLLKKLDLVGHISNGAPTGSGKTLMLICSLMAYICNLLAKI